MNDWRWKLGKRKDCNGQDGIYKGISSISGKKLSIYEPVFKRVAFDSRYLETFQIQGMVSDADTAT